MPTCAAPKLVHIGFHKTGTTWLQTGLFQTAPFELCWDSTAIAETVILPHALEWSAEAARSEIVRRASGGGDAETIKVMSWERLSGSPHAGGYDSALIADRLHDLFPDARILVGIREQRSMIEALYRQYVRDGGIASLAGYLHPRNPAEIPQFRFDHLEYDRLVSRYIELFGPDRVVVLPYEELLSDERAFVERICRFCNVDPPSSIATADAYSGLRPLTTLLKRQANKVFVRNSLSPAARYYVKNHEARFDRINEVLPRIADDRVRSGWRERIAKDAAGRYEESNSRLGSLVGLDLRCHGYAVVANG